MRMKYINLKLAGYVIFEELTSHKDMAAKFPRDEVISAGFVAMWATDDEMQVQASDGSQTLKVNSLDNDAEHIKRRICLY